MRPNTIRWFEYALIASQAIRFASVAIYGKAMAEEFGVDVRTIYMSPIVNALIAIGLALAISRGRAGFARWFMVLIIGLDVLGLASINDLALRFGATFAAMTALASFLMLAAGILMFLPESTAWLKRDKKAD